MNCRLEFGLYQGQSRESGRSWGTVPAGQGSGTSNRSIMNLTWFGVAGTGFRACISIDWNFMSSLSFKKSSETKAAFPAAQHRGEPQGKVHLKAAVKDVLYWPPRVLLHLSTKWANNSQMRFTTPVQGAPVCSETLCPLKSEHKTRNRGCSLAGHWPRQPLLVTGHGPMEIWPNSQFCRFSSCSRTPAGWSS